MTTKAEAQADDRGAQWLAYWTERIRQFWSLGAVDPSRFYRNQVDE